MGLARFVRELAQAGRVVLPLHADESDRGLLDEELREVDARARAHAPGTAPALDITAATWAADRLRSLCHLLKSDGSETGIDGTPLLTAAPFAPTATTLWSVDLFFRCLPDVDRLAANLPEDAPQAAPLRRALRQLAAAWPLASLTGDTGPDAAPPDPVALAIITADPGLRRLRADRLAQTLSSSRG